jgi:hypothetical protein
LNKEGTFLNFGKVWFDNRLQVNILSFPALVASGAKIVYNSAKDHFLVKPPRSDNFLIFRRDLKNGLYMIEIQNVMTRINSDCDQGGHVADTKKIQFLPHTVNVTTVQQNQRNFTARESKEAEDARLLMDQIGITNSVAAKRVFNNMLNCKVTERAVDVADLIYGPRSFRSLNGNCWSSHRSKASATTASRID